MAGPYCRDCEHYDPGMRSKDTGECLDPTKRIYYKHGAVKNEAPTIHETDTCQNWSPKTMNQVPTTYVKTPLAEAMYGDRADSKALNEKVKLTPADEEALKHLPCTGWFQIHAISYMIRRPRWRSMTTQDVRGGSHRRGSATDQAHRPAPAETVGRKETNL